MTKKTIISLVDGLLIMAAITAFVAEPDERLYGYWWFSQSVSLKIIAAFFVALIWIIHMDVSDTRHSADSER